VKHELANKVTGPNAGGLRHSAIWASVARDARRMLSIVSERLRTGQG
jgi:hypothetical protein